MVTFKRRFDRRLYSQKGYHNFANIWFGLVWFDLLVVTVESFRFDVEKGLRNKLRTLNQETLTASLPSDSFHFSSNLV